MASTSGISHGTSHNDQPPKLSVPDAATALGVSINTVRRWIKEGSLVAEREARTGTYLP